MQSTKLLPLRQHVSKGSLCTSVYTYVYLRIPMYFCVFLCVVEVSKSCLSVLSTSPNGDASSSRTTSLLLKKVSALQNLHNLLTVKSNWKICTSIFTMAWVYLDIPHLKITPLVGNLYVGNLDTQV